MSIIVDKLSYIYDKGSPFETKAIDNVSFEIRKGEFIGLIGHTGSGKSTLIQQLNGLLKPSSGLIFINGLDITQKSLKLSALRKKVGLVFQYPEYQLFEETVSKDIAYGPGNLGLAQDEIDVRVKESMEAVGLDYELIKDKSPFELSGGQKRRVAIAGVLAMKPEVLILDEPTAGLDPVGKSDILAQIKRIHEKEGITIILVSHSMEDVSRLVDKLLVMHKGSVAFFDKPSNVFRNAKEIEAIGLDIPATTKIIQSLNERGFDIDETIFDVDEVVNKIFDNLRSK